MSSRETKNALRWFSNLTEKEHNGVKNKFEEMVKKEIKELTVEDIYRIYTTFFGMC